MVSIDIEIVLIPMFV